MNPGSFVPSDSFFRMSDCFYPIFRGLARPFGGGVAVFDHFAGLLRKCLSRNHAAHSQNDFLWVRCDFLGGLNDNLYTRCDPLGV